MVRPPGRVTVVARLLVGLRQLGCVGSVGVVRARARVHIDRDNDDDVIDEHIVHHLVEHVDIDIDIDDDTRAVGDRAAGDRPIGARSRHHCVPHG